MSIISRYLYILLGECLRQTFHPEEDEDEKD